MAQANGRPSTFSESKEAVILAALRRGLPRRAAAADAGVGHSTFYEWLNKGARGEEPYATFVLKIEAAEAELMSEELAQIRSAEDWRSKAWLLERRFSRHFSAKMSVEFNKALDDILKAAEEVLDVSSYQKLLTVIASADSEETP